MSESINLKKVKEIFGEFVEGEGEGKLFWSDWLRHEIINWAVGKRKIEEIRERVQVLKNVDPANVVLLNSSNKIKQERTEFVYRVWSALSGEEFDKSNVEKELVNAAENLDIRPFNGTLDIGLKNFIHRLNDYWLSLFMYKFNRLVGPNCTSKEISDFVDRQIEESFGDLEKALKDLDSLVE